MLALRFFCFLSFSLGLIACNSAVEDLDKQDRSRVTQNLLALYLFNNGDSIQNNAVIQDNGSYGAALDLSITDPSTGLVDPNKVNWLNNGIQFSSETTILQTEPNDKINTAIESSKALTVEAWIQAANLVQAGPARIISISTSPSSRNFTLGQSASSYVIRLNTSNNSDNGTTALSSAQGTLSTELSHIVFTWDATNNNTANFFKNGELLISSTTRFTGNLSPWSADSPLIFGNEINIVDGSSRFWLGNIYLVAIYDRALSQQEIRRNFNAGSH